MKDFIQFGSKKLHYTIEYSNRKSLGITVTPELNVKVKAPINTKDDVIKAKVLKRAPWILKQQSFFLAYFPKTPLRRYVGGETHLYMGKQYRLKIVQRKHESVKLKGKHLEVHCEDKSSAKSLVQGWYLTKAKDKLNALASPLIDNFKKYKVAPTSIVFRDMPTRWGSCTAKGKIILNPELIKAPKACIEYVIIHELCHLIHHDHTQRFLELQAKEMPDWEKWKTKLETLMA